MSQAWCKDIEIVGKKNVESQVASTFLDSTFFFPTIAREGY
jgi:hypothetical protein